MKSRVPWMPFPSGGVAPCVGAWVEIWVICPRRRRENVAPCVGAWVEIELSERRRRGEPRRPLRGGVG